AQGMIWTFSRLGGFVAPLLVLWLIRIFGSWEIPLWLLAGLGGLWCLFFWLWFRNRPEDHPTVNAAELSVIKCAPERPADAINLPLPSEKSEAYTAPSPIQQVPISPPIYPPDQKVSATPSPVRRVPLSRFLASPSVWGLCLMYGFGGFAGNFITSLLP